MNLILVELIIHNKQRYLTTHLLFVNVYVCASCGHLDEGRVLIRSSVSFVVPGGQTDSEAPTP